jgi:hypothetical protein
LHGSDAILLSLRVATRPSVLNPSKCGARFSFRWTVPEFQARQRREMRRAIDANTLRSNFRLHATVYSES